MTTLVTWETDGLPGHFDEKAILVISDSRISKSAGAGKLTDRGEKIATIDIRFHKRAPNEIQNEGVIEKRIIAAVAGSTLVAHSAILCAQYALGSLVGPTPPTMNDICTFFAELLTDITRDVGTLEGNGACSEVILIGSEIDEPVAYSLRPEFPLTGQVVYAAHRINGFPYVVGSDRKAFEAEYREAVTSGQFEGEPFRQLDQLPFRIFDKLFFMEDAAKQTGGEMHIAAVTKNQTQRFMPMRWNEAKASYEFFVFGNDTFKKKIGSCTIGICPWQLGS